MSLLDLIREVGEERQQFRDSFRERINGSLQTAVMSGSAREYLEEQLMDEGMTRYYRFSVTAANELKGFGFKVQEERENELRYGMGLMLFWLRLTDRVIDSRPDKNTIIGNIHAYLNDGIQLPYTGESLVESTYFATELLRGHANSEGYIGKLNGSLHAMTNSMMNEVKDFASISGYCDARESTSVGLAETFLMIMGNYISPEFGVDFKRFRNFFYEQFKAGILLDTLSDFGKDYKAGIAPQPTIGRRFYVTWRMIKNTAKYFAYLPRSIEGTTRLLSYSTFSIYHLLRDSSTQG